MKKKYIIMVSLSVILTLLLGIGVSYSLWNISVSQDKVNTAMTSCFDITYSSESSAINLEKQYPISDEAGSKLTPYTFKITNNCDINAYYKINLETLNTSNIDTGFLKASLNNENTQVINRYSKTETSLKNGKVANTLKIGYLPVGGSISFDLRVWIDYDTTIDDIKNDGTDKWVGKIIVISSPVTEDKINKACQEKGGDLIDGGECRKYFVKLNEKFVNNDFSSPNGWIMWNNENEKNTASEYIVFEKFNLHFTGKIQSQLWQRVDEIPEHIYFVFTEVNSGIGNFGFNNIYDDEVKSEHHWNIVRWLYSNSKENNSIYIDKTYATGKSSYLFELFFKEVDFNVSYKYMNVVDLTLMFGEGKEPNKEWCDKYLTDYLEYNKEGTLTPIKEIGEPIKTSYYDKADMFD